MVVHYRKRQAIDGEDRSQELQTIANPTTTVFVRVPRQRIVTTEKRTSDAFLHTVNHLHFGRIQNFTTSLTRHHIDSERRNIRAAKPSRPFLWYAFERNGQAENACPFSFFLFFLLSDEPSAVRHRATHPARPLTRLGSLNRQPLTRRDMILNPYIIQKPSRFVK